MHRLSLSLLPRGVFATFVLACAMFAVAAVWTVGAGATSQIPRHISELLHDNQLITAFHNTLTLFLLSVGLQIFICIVGTSFIHSARPAIMATLLIPYATGVVAPAFAFFVLLSTGIGPLDVAIANSIWSQRIIVALIDTWQWLGILLVAALFQINQIPRSYFQAADLEGIGRWRRWRLIIWPQTWFVLLMYTLFRLLDWLRKVDLVNALFGRGYGGALQTIAMYVEQVRYQSSPELAGSASGFQDTYGDFLALLQFTILIAAAICISRTKLVNDLYTTGSLVERASSTHAFLRLRRFVAVSLYWLAVFLVILGPILWIASLSLQNVDVSDSGDSRFRLIPTHPTLDAYRSILSANKDASSGSAQGIAQGLIFSLQLCSVSAVIACIVAIATAFMFVADLRAEKLRGPILAFALSIFFFPPVIASPALDTLGRWFTWFGTPSVQLAFVYFSNAFVLSFILLLIRYMTIPRAYFEQTLLETKSRTLAFYDAYIRYEFGALFFILVLAFSSCWSEFYVSSFITATQETKPFSVVLEMNHGQYNAYYSLFAAGAGLSLIVSVAFPVLTLAMLWLISRASFAIRRIHRRTEKLAEGVATR